MQEIMLAHSHYSAVVIGASAGGLGALSTLLGGLYENYHLPVIIVQHRAKEEKELLETILQQKCKIKVKQADEKERIIQGVYIAPPDYHLLVEKDRTFSLSKDLAVNHSRPSIDVLFETAAYAYKDELVGVILTGSNDDGANGIRAIHRYRGLTIAQNPGEASHPAMPVASIRTGAVRHILLLNEIQELLFQIANDRNAEAS